MAARAIVDLHLALIKGYQVKSGTTLTLYQRVKFGTADNEVDAAAANDEGAFGTFVGFQQAPGLSNAIPATATDGSNAPVTVTGDGTDKFVVSIALDGNAIVPMTVGTGGSTRGLKQVYVSTGVTDGPTNGGGTTPHSLAGRAMQTGVAGDLVGVLTGGAGYFVAAT